MDIAKHNNNDYIIYILYYLGVYSDVSSNTSNFRTQNSKQIRYLQKSTDSEHHYCTSEKLKEEINWKEWSLQKVWN